MSCCVQGRWQSVRQQTEGAAKDWLASQSAIPSDESRRFNVSASGAMVGWFSSVPKAPTICASAKREQVASLAAAQTAAHSSTAEAAQDQQKERVAIGRSANQPTRSKSARCENIKRFASAFVGPAAKRPPSGTLPLRFLTAKRKRDCKTSSVFHFFDLVCLLVCRVLKTVVTLHCASRRAGMPLCENKGAE